MVSHSNMVFKIGQRTDLHARFAIAELSELNSARPHTQAIAHALYELRV
jgi:hypothetical protein